MSFKIGGREVKSGSTEFLWLKVATLLDGNDLRIPLHVIHGKGTSPVLGLFASIHGTEYYQNRIIRRIVNETDPKSIKGTILAVPVANPLAFSHATRQSPSPPEETVDFSNLNRVFPGRRSTPLFGSTEPTDVSLTMKMAQVLVDEVVEKCTHIIDFHGQMPGMALRKMLFNRDDASREMARIFGLGILHDPPEAAGKGTLTPMTDYAGTLGISCIVAEIGGGGHSERFERQVEEMGVQGTRNVMIHLGMQPGEMKLPDRQFYFTEAPHVRSTTGGYYVTDILPEDVGIGQPPREVRGGAVLGVVYSPYTLDVKEEIRSPSDGFLYACRVSGIVEAQSEILAIANLKGSKWID